MTSKFIWKAFENQKDELFLIDGSQSYTYNQFLQKVISVAYQDKFRVKAGQKVALVIDNSLESLVLLFALMYKGAIPVLLSEKNL